ncbi:hypothetical protein H8B13_10545 [Hymenobacter sp. BT188]|uniref:hypothetical protein n=1 Tax=Hymenobacter sp. BT188 TaxID=2763504 RepID=UPI0016519503|nr:hypothetical protein [Hymenobacter sp. BT188]MBC6607257.1 hypothetical protein [Hymenobacter sp. BT188]
MKNQSSSRLRYFLPSIFVWLVLLAGCQSAEEKLQDHLSNPKAGDVYVVSYQPAGTTKPSYFYYQLVRFTADSSFFHPARREVPSADISLEKEPNLFNSDDIKSFSRQELREFTQAQQGDAYKILLTAIRRE